MNSPMFLEAVMLVCFGLAWPLATLKMLRCGRVEGRGVGFTLIILSGYLVGSLSKLAAAEPGAADATCVLAVSAEHGFGGVECRLAVASATQGRNRAQRHFRRLSRRDRHADI